MTTNTTSTAATEKQISYLVSLANKASGTQFRFPSQIPWLRQRLTMAERSGRISKVRASALIDELLAA